MDFGREGRREKTDMWPVICKKNNEDQFSLPLVPWNSLSARRLSLVIDDDGGEAKGGEEVRRIK